MGTFVQSDQSHFPSSGLWEELRQDHIHCLGIKPMELALQDQSVPMQNYSDMCTDSQLEIWESPDDDLRQFSDFCLILLHSERPKLYAILAYLSAIGLIRGS